MIIGIENFGNSICQCFDEQLTRKYNYIKVDNCILDEIYCENDHDLAFTTQKIDWNDYTIFLGEFQNSLECGNVKGIEGKDVTDLVFLKRRKNSNDPWTTIDIQKYSYDRTSSHLYAYADMLAYGGEEYEYGIQPIVIPEGSNYLSAVKGNIESASTILNFDGLFITDGEQTFCLNAELDMGSIDKNVLENKMTTLGRKYPIYQRISETDYDSGSIKAMVLSPESRKGGYPNNSADRILVDEIRNMICYGDSLLMKDGMGRKYIIHISDVKYSGEKEFQGGLPTLEFKWEQIGDALNEQDLIDNYLLEDFSLYPIGW